MLLTWNKSLEIGNDVIDRQHKEIFSRVNKLLSAMAHGEGREEVGKLITFLADYVIKHFTAEEKLMVRDTYDGYLLQKDQHAQFIKDFSSVKKEFEIQGATSNLVVQVQKQLCSWLRNHISKEDKAFGIFLKTKEQFSPEKLT